MLHHRNFAYVPELSSVYFGALKMSFRRIPFRFSSTDPVERQRELEKRFLGSKDNNMYVDAANPLTMGSGLNTSTSSPRFQCRVPMFVDGKPAQSSVDSSACENKTPKVRVIPIEIETEENSPSSRRRTFSGPAGIPKQVNKETCHQKADASTLKRSMGDLTKPTKMKAASGPRVYNIPIKVEQSGVREKKTKSEKGKMPEMKSHPTVNCDTPKHDQNVEPEPSPKEKEAELTEEERMKININDSLKKIDCVREELKSYEAGVNDFNGTAKDKQYRYLDEMLTRCMIKLDDIETMGNEEVRSARKKVVKMVQACIDLLESKVNIVGTPDTSMNTNVPRVDAIEKQDNAEQPTVFEENALDINVNSNTVDIPEENQLITNTDESKLPQSESLTQEEMHANHSACKPEVDDVPEVEMAEVTSTSSDVNQNEKTGIDNLVSDQSQSDVMNVNSDETIAQSSVPNEVEMIDVTTQDQKELPKPEVSSTNISHLDNVTLEPAQINDLNEAKMTDVSSTCNSSSENQTVEAIPEVSSSILQPDTFALNLEMSPADTAMSEDCKIMKNVKTQETDINSSSDSNAVSSIPEVEMKEIVENSCQIDTTTVDDEQCKLQP